MSPRLEQFMKLKGDYVTSIGNMLHDVTRLSETGTHCVDVTFSAGFGPCVTAAE
jgi:hypothetical protein